MSAKKYEIQIKIIKELSSLINTLSSPEQALKIIVVLTSDLMNVEICSLMLPADGYLYIKYAVGLDDKIIQNSRVKKGKSISGWVWENKKPLLIKDIEKNRKFKRKNKERYYTASLLSIPVLKGGSVLGVLNVNNKKDKSPFDEYDLQAIQVVANLITVVLTNSSNIEIMRKNLSQLSLMYETQNILSSTLELNKRMNIVLTTLRNILKFSAAAIFLIDKTNSYFEKNFSYSAPRFSASRVFLSKIPVKIKKTIFENKEIFYTENNIYKSFGFKNYKDLFILPLIFENKVMGFVLAYGVLFNLKDKDLLKFLAAGMAGSITNSLLYEEQHKKYIELYYMQARLKETNRELEFLNSYNNLIIESLGSGFLVIDDQNKINTLNTSALEIFGLSNKKKILGRAFSPRVFPENFVNEILKAVSRRENVVGREINAAGKIIGISISYSNDPMFKGSIIRFRDMTETINLREQLFNSEKMASIGRLATGIAHELNNPLASISGFIQLMEKGLIESEEKKKRYFKEIMYEAGRMADIISSLLNFAKIKPQDFKQHNLIDIVNRVKFLLVSKLKSKKIKVKQQAPRKLMFKCDVNQMESLFMNLFVNAIDACENGAIFLKIKKEDNIVIEFKDTGVGIEKSDLTRIFEPFYSKKEKGSGLGLSIVYNIVKAHNGKIQAESQKGEYTKFTIIF